MLAEYTYVKKAFHSKKKHEKFAVACGSRSHHKVEFGQSTLWQRKDKKVQSCLFHYLSEGIVTTLWDAIFDIETKQLRNSLGFNISVFIVYVSNG